MKNDFSDFSSLDALMNHPVSHQIDQSFKSVIKHEEIKQVNKQKVEAVSIKDKELKIEDSEIEIDLGGHETPQDSPLDEGLELNLDAGEELDLGDGQYSDGPSGESEYGDISLDEEEMSDGESLNEEEVIENLGELSLDEAPALPEENTQESDLSLSGDQDLSLEPQDPAFSLGDDSSQAEKGEELTLDSGDLSSDAMEKLKEIDAILEYDASQVGINSLATLGDKGGEDLDQPLVSDDLDLASLNFSNESVPQIASKEDKSKKKRKDSSQARSNGNRFLEGDLKEISGAYSGEIERFQATISNLRADREELLAKIQNLEDEKVLHNRQTLSLRAELDEKKIELTIMRRKLNDEIAELKDRLKVQDEKRLILEEKNRLLVQDIDKAAQKNKMDVKKVSLRERELEQKLELLKSDAETQIRNRDMKILELKRRIDAMEFDMESISQQEKRSVESRHELEDKLDKAIKTLRGAITVLEDESDRTSVLNALKKNIDV